MHVLTSRNTHTALALDSRVQGYVGIREMHAPLVSAVHGAMVGGAAAMFLQTDLRIAESKATFQHGNLSRGVCPLAGYSRTLQVAVGTPHAAAYYLTDDKHTSATALALGLVHAVRAGVSKVQQGARSLGRDVPHSLTAGPQFQHDDVIVA